MPLVQTRGAASAQGFGEFAQAAVAANYIEEVFSTYLYDGGFTGAIVNGIDLSTKGGLVWFKFRSGTATETNHELFDTARGTGKFLVTNSTAAQVTDASSLNAFNTNGFNIQTDPGMDAAGSIYVSWTFRKQPKFFDVVTWSGNGTTQAISHNLGSVPGFIIIKRTDSADDWWCFHRYDFTQRFKLNATNAAVNTNNQSYLGNNTIAVTPTSTTFTVGSISGINASGGTYVAYIYAHDAAGFGLTGTDNVISCGTYTGNGSATGPVVTLGYEPQWILIKDTTDANEWHLFDTMRGIATGGIDPWLEAQSSGAEQGSDNMLSVLATGFQPTNATPRINTSGAAYIYIAIRRGPMKVPTSGTGVFGLSARTGTGAIATVTGGQTDDAVLVKNRGSAVASLFSSRLTGTGYLVTSTTAAEVAAGTTILQANPWNVMDGVKVGTTSTITNASSNTYINYLFKRAPSFMDVVCYTGGITSNPSHNLGVTPEMYIVKCRSSGTSDRGWHVYHSGYDTANYYILMNSSSGLASLAGVWSSGPTATTFGVENGYAVNDSGQTYVAYLFATCAGVSKVGSYTGTATTLQIDCGFTAGARFVLIKRTDSTGDWYVWDTARGIVSGNDQYFLLNTTAAEVTNTDYIDTYSAGFEISSTAPAAINASAGTFIFLAIA